MSAGSPPASERPASEATATAPQDACKQDEERLAALSGPFCNYEHREGNLTRSRYHRLSVIQRFKVLCDRSQIRI